MAIVEQEVAASGAGDVNSYLQILGEDAVYLPPNLEAKQGEELREWLGDFVRRFRVEWLEFVHGQTVAVGDLAYHDYTYRWRVTPKANGQAILSQGKGLYILRKLPDGSWKVSRNIWNASPLTRT